MKTILTSEIKPAGNGRLAIRIALNETGGYTPWATHMQCQDERTGEWHNNHGGYHHDAQAAMVGYIERCQQYGLSPLPIPELEV